MVYRSMMMPPLSIAADAMPRHYCCCRFSYAIEIPRAYDAATLLPSRHEIRHLMPRCYATPLDDAMPPLRLPRFSLIRATLARCPLPFRRLMLPRLCRHAAAAERVERRRLLRVYDAKRPRAY